MNNSVSFENFFAQTLVLIMAGTAIYAITNTIGSTISGRIFYLLTPAIMFMVYVKKYNVPKLYVVYSTTIFIIVLLHNLAGVEVEDTIHYTCFVRITPVLLLVIYNNQKKPFKAIFIFGLIFYILECGISIYEKITLTHLIDYAKVEDTQATNNLMLYSTDFRSFSLMFHPLFNANTISIFLAFILCNKKLNIIMKSSLLILGLLAIWGTNSRGCLIIWFIILTYRLTIYNAKLFYAIIAIPLSYFLLPILVDWLIVSGILGRLDSLDFDDGSTLTRLEAFNVFINYEWSLQDLLIGGRMLTYPGFVIDVGLENGFLLDLGYWGIIGGLIKSIGEILITFFTLRKYKKKDIFIFMLAIWGCAFMNNNSYNSFIMPMFVIAFIIFDSFDSMKERKSQIYVQ